MSASQIQQIIGLLKKYKRRIRLYDGWLLAQKTLWIVLAVIVCLQIIGRLWPVANILSISYIIASGWLLSVILISLLKPLRPLQVSWRVDVELAIKERLSSAIMLQSFVETHPDSSPATKELISLQRGDALATLKSKHPSQAFKLRWQKRQLLISGLLLIAAMASIFLPNPMDSILAERAAAAEAAQAEAEKIDELRQEIEASDQLSEEEREELLRQLEELAERLRENSGDRAEALADISKAEEALRERLNPQADLRQAALDALETKLSSLSQQLADAEEGEASSTEDALEALLNALEGMEQSETDALAQALQQLAAQAAQAGDTSLAEALSAMSQAAQSGNSAEAQSAAQEISDAAAQAAGELSDQEAIEQALSQLQQSQQALSQSGQPAQTASGQPGQQPGSGQQPGAGQQPGQGNQPGQGQQPGQGNQPGQGQTTGGGGGTNADSLPPNTSSGQAGNPQGNPQGGQTGQLDDQVYVPWDRLQGENDPLSISGQDTGQGEDTVREQDTPLPGSLSPVSVPYQAVYGSYLDTAYQTIDQSYIPSGLKDYILKYFSQLEPGE